jgi:general secretion pathway protein D
VKWRVTSGRVIGGLVLSGVLMAAAAAQAPSELADPPSGDAPAPVAEASPETAPAVESEGTPLGADESVVLNFERGDIREVIHSLATALGLSYTIDPRIEGQVTIRTTGRIAREDLFPLFNQILRNNGIAAVKVGNVYQIVPVAEGKTRAIVPRTAATRAEAAAADHFVIEIVPVSHVTAEEMVNVLQPFVTPGGDVLAYPRANLLVITDIDSNVARLRDLLRTFDTDLFRGMRARVYKIKHGDIDLVSEELAVLLGSYGHATDGSTGLSVIPMSRLESLVVISFDAGIFAEIDRWLRMLDIPPEEGAGRKTYVYAVENAKAADLAAVLNELYGGGGGGAGGGALGGAFGQARGAFGRAGTTAGGALGTGGGTTGRRGFGTGTGGRRSGLSGAGGEAETAGLTGGAGLTAAQQTGGLGGGTIGGTQRGVAGRAGTTARGRAAIGAGAGGAVGVVLPGGSQAGGVGAGGIPGPPPIFKQEVRIVADEVTNSLVILAVKQDYEMILDVLKKLDVVPRQVVIEVLIAEVTLNKGLEFGLDHALRSGNITLSNRESPAGAPADSGDGDGTGGSASNSNLTDVSNTVFSLLSPGTRGLQALITNKEDFAVLVRALANRSLLKVLSAPHIIAADNREAHILVGNSVPILSSSSVTLTGSDTITNQVQYRDVGTILTILPQVNSQGLVNMQIRQEASTVGDDSFGSTNSPAFLTREAETTLVVQSGDTVLIGGIIDDQRNHTRRGVPYLMDIPVFGRLFGFETTTLMRTELIVLITPHVIRDRGEARSVTDEFKRNIFGLERMLRRQKRSTPFDVGENAAGDENGEPDGP